MTWPSVSRGSILAAGAISTLFAFSYVGAARHLSRSPTPSATPYRSSAIGRQEDSGLLVVYITSSQCSAAQDSELPGLLAAKLRRLEATGSRWKLGVASIAVALDDNPVRGVTELMRYSGFQEVAAGAGQGNLLHQAFFRGGNAGNDATPGVVIAEWVGSHGLMDSREALVMRRLIGLAEIKRWARDTAETDIVSLAKRVPFPDSTHSQPFRR